MPCYVISFSFLIKGAKADAYFIKNTSTYFLFFEKSCLVLSKFSFVIIWFTIQLKN